MFTGAPGAGACGFAVLNRHLAEWGFALHDVKLPSEHFRMLGFLQMPREEYANVFVGAACRVAAWALAERTGAVRASACRISAAREHRDVKAVGVGRRGG